MPKCTYCRKETVEKIPLDNFTELFCCSEECKKLILKYVNFGNKNGTLFIALTLGSVLLMVLANGMIAALNLDKHYMSLITLIALAVIGITVIKFPFCTPQTIQMFGIKKSMIIARVLGFIMIVLGLSTFIIGE